MFHVNSSAIVEERSCRANVQRRCFSPRTVSLKSMPAPIPQSRMVKPSRRHLIVLTGDCRKLLKTCPRTRFIAASPARPYWGLRDYGHAAQIGQERTPEEYVGNLQAVFAEVWRVLRSDGTLWLNLGDSSWGSWGNYSAAKRGGKSPGQTPAGPVRHFRPPMFGGNNITRLKPKDLCGMPWRVAFALQADGWYLRSDIIWHKPNPTPESVGDRPTKAHEYLFLLTKSRRYFYDAEAIREPAACGRDGPPFERARRHSVRLNANGKPREPARWNESSGKTSRVPGREAPRAVRAWRNKRTVWTVPPQPYQGAHFATYPPGLVRPCILAGTSARGCCPQCGTPWRRITKKGAPLREWKRLCGADATGGYGGHATKDYAAAKAQDASAVKARILEGMRETRTVGWRPGCECSGGESVACTVLDPFAGSGTTGQVALELGRRAMLIELKADYTKLIEERCE